MTRPAAILVALLLCLPAALHAQDADSAWAAGHHDAAGRIYAARLAADSGDVTALRRLGTLRARAGRHAEAIALYERAVRLAPGDTELRIEQARVLGWAGQYGRAAAAFEEMLRQHPGNREITIGLAQVLTWAGRTDSATVIFRRMLAQDPDDDDALKGLARVMTWSGDLRGGETYWRRVVARAPRDAEALAGLGSNLRAQGRDAAALAALRRARTLDPADPELRVLLESAEAAVAPHVSPTYTYESDSDRNLMHTVSAVSSYRPRIALETRVHAYQRELRGTDVSGEQRSVRTLGGMGGVAVQLEPGWKVSGAIGASRAADAGADPLLAARAAIAAPRWLPVTAALTLERAAFDYTAALALNRVRTDQLILDAAARLNTRWHASGTAAVARFRGSESNRQLSAALATTYRVFGPLSLGAAARTFTFEKDREELREGYFNPDFYGSIEATAALNHQSGRLVLAGELAPGVQRIGSEGERSGSFRAALRTAYSFAPGRELGVSATYADSGVQQLYAADTLQYHYRAFSVFGTWTFRRAPRR